VNKKVLLREKKASLQRGLSPTHFPDAKKQLNKKLLTTPSLIEKEVLEKNLDFVGSK